VFWRSVRPQGPLRVLFVVPDLTVGGAERHVATLLPAMDRDRFAPSVLCINQPGPLFAEVAAANIPAVALDEPKDDPRALVRALVALTRHLRRTRPDVVVMRGANAELLGRVGAVLARVPRTVVWVHNCGTVAALRRSQRLADRLLAPATSTYYGLARGQVPYLVEDRGFDPAKIRLVHNGVDPAAYPYVPFDERRPGLAAELGIEPGEPVAGIVAAVRAEKDHLTFLRAARLVLEKLPRARFLVVGRGRHPQDLERVVEQARELGIAERVVFTGRRADVADVVATMDVFCLTSYTVECFPISLLEAMAVGRAAVCTAVGGVPDMIDEGVTGHVVPPRNPQALAERLVELLADPARAEKMGRAARERVEARFTLAGSVREAEHALEETAGRRVPAAAEGGRSS